MKVLLLNSVDDLGGAAKSAQRLCRGLLARDVQATMLVQRKVSSDVFSSGPAGFWAQWFSDIRPHLDASPVCMYPNRTRAIFSPAFLPETLKKKFEAIAPDLLHLHWVCEGLLRVETLRSVTVPVVWTLHDSWPFTGGCHLPSDCTRYDECCGSCPTLGSNSPLDLSSWIWKRKRKVYQHLDLTVVAPSSWMADKARSSSLFRSKRIVTIPNGVDLSVYRPHDQEFARTVLGLPQDKKIIMFSAIAGCNDPNKGFRSLTEAISALQESGLAKDCVLILLGSHLPASEDVDMPTISMGRMADDVSIALALSAADVTVVPSLQENLPYSVMESMACGTPCVAFRVGGIQDIIDHGENGCLIDPFDVKAFVEGILWVLKGAGGIPLRQNGRRKICDTFSIEGVTARYIELYRQIIAERRSR